jgi:hypothetical protein
MLKSALQSNKMERPPPFLRMTVSKTLNWKLPAENERNDREDEKDEKDDFRHSSGTGGQPAKAEQRREHSNDEEHSCPVQHEDLLGKCPTNSVVLTQSGQNEKNPYFRDSSSLSGSR